MNNSTNQITDISSVRVDRRHKRRKIECKICAEYTWEDSGQKKNQWTCTTCEFSCCQQCARRYLLDSISDPQCMSCNARISRHDLIQEFPKTWVTGAFKKHREDVLIDREKALIPASVEAVERERTMRNSRALLTELEKEHARIYQLLRENQDSITATRRVIRNRGVPDAASEMYEGGKSFQVVKCQKEGCTAFARKNAECSACGTLTCYECMEVIQDASKHVCDEESKETVAAARKHAKACPGCGEYISKVEGCNQMWCIKCHTTFDYRTGRKVTEAVHNPHYYEYMRKNPSATTRDPRDVQCGGIPEYADIVRINHALQRRPQLPDNGWRKVNEKFGILMNIFFSAHRLLTHIHNVEVPRYQNDANASTESLRVAFILKDLNADDFKIKLQRHEKRRNYRSEMLEVFVMVQTAGTDILQRLVHLRSLDSHTKSLEVIASFKTELVNLATYANGLFGHISASYSVTSCKINTEWTVLL